MDGVDGGGTVGLGVMVGGWVAGRIQRMKTWQLEETRQDKTRRDEREETFGREN